MATFMDMERGLAASRIFDLTNSECVDVGCSAFIWLAVQPDGSEIPALRHSSITVPGSKWTGFFMSSSSTGALLDKMKLISAATSAAATSVGGKTSRNARGALGPTHKAYSRSARSDAVPRGRGPPKEAAVGSGKGLGSVAYERMATV